MDSLKVVKYISFSVEILLVFIIQNTPFLMPEAFGSKAVLLIPLALSIAAFEEETQAVVFGAVCGLIADCGFGGPIGFYAVVLSVVCYAISFFLGNYMRTNLFTVMMISLLTVPIVIFLQFFFYYILMGYDSMWEFFAAHYISRMVYTIAVTPIFYGINKFISYRLTLR